MALRTSDSKYWERTSKGSEEKKATSRTANTIETIKRMRWSFRLAIMVVVTESILNEEKVYVKRFRQIRKNRASTDCSNNLSRADYSYNLQKNRHSRNIEMREEE